MMKKFLPALLVCCLAAAPQLQTARAENGEWTNLLDAKLSHWELWMGVPHSSVKGLPAGTPQSDDIRNGTPLGLANDPKHVFSMIEENGQPVLKITGEIYGGLTTLKDYENYHFSCEVKFGQKKWAPRLEKDRDSGLLYHCTGEHGKFWNVWMASMEFQIIEGGMGDLYMLAGPVSDIRITPSEKNQSSTPYKGIWNPASETIVSAHPIQRSANHENPNGQWNTLELYAVGRQAIHCVNGQPVLAVDNIRLKDGKPLSKGKIQLQAEGAEVYYRNVKIRAITAFPAALREKSKL